MLRPTVLLSGPARWEHHHDAFAAAGYRVAAVPSTGATVDALRAHRADLVVLDADENGVDVHEVCRRIRALGTVPIIVMGAPHAHGQVEEIVQLMAFAAGADDVVPSDLSPRLLLARSGALLRRTVAEPAPASTREVGPFVLDPESRTAMLAGTELDLTRIEFDLLAILLEHPTRVVPRDELVSRVWGSWFGDDHVVEVHLSRLRAKVVRAGGPRIGVAVRGVGYRLGLGTPVAV
jgi:DNA-binding response OmpR family regulator